MKNGGKNKSVAFIFLFSINDLHYKSSEIMHTVFPDER